ncbi:MAG: hypothetical protein HFI46_01045 [Lachnospiraceae bacterium]|nr:hypothetical protein [Lachnospiraceae bacterium]
MKNTLYIPQTATPFRQDEEYTELLPVNTELSKYIRCFWGSRLPYYPKGQALSGLVIPDTCMDIIYQIDHTENTVTGIFCGLNDKSFSSCSEKSQDILSPYSPFGFMPGAPVPLARIP